MGKSLVTLVVLGLILLAGQLDNVPLGSLGGQKTDVPVVEAPVCKDRDPKEHVYHPQRLTLIARCAQVTGTVASIRYEDDGDFHIDVDLDPPYQQLLNDGNRRLQHGWLVVEPVCMNYPTVASAKEACGDYTNPMERPKVGQHVVIIGPYVLDTEHSNWAEIHPAWQINPI